MKSSQLQSLSRRIKNTLAATHAEIRFEAASLSGNDEFDKKTYSTLSKLQRERKKLEALAVSLKKELKAQVQVEAAAKTLRAHSKSKLNLIIVSVDGLDAL